MSCVWAGGAAADAGPLRNPVALIIHPVTGAVFSGSSMIGSVLRKRQTEKSTIGTVR